jgi:hypothetical protein
MKFSVLPVINEYPSNIAPFREQYSDPYAAKLAFKRSKWVYLRTRLAEAQNWKCCFCGCVMTELRNKGNSATVEHVIPKDFGGTDDAENLVASCNYCNNKRGTVDAYTFTSQISNDEKTKTLVRLEAKIRKYVKKAKKLAEIGFNVNDRIQTFEAWFATLSLCNKGKKMFFEEYKAV